MADTNRPQNRALNVITVGPVEVKYKLNSIKKDLSWLKKGGLATQSNSPGSAPVMCSNTWHSTREQWSTSRTSLAGDVWAQVT